MLLIFLLLWSLCCGDGEECSEYPSLCRPGFYNNNRECEHCDTEAYCCNACSNIANCLSITCVGPSSSVCGSCAVGYRRGSGGTSCPECVRCPAGEGANTACTASTVCVPCTGGVAYSVGVSYTECNDCSTCPPGEGVTTFCDPSTNTECEPCTAEFFSASNDQQACQSCTVCALGEEQTSECLSTANRVCTACARGTYGGGPTNVACTTCPTRSTTASTGAEGYSQCVCTKGSTGNDAGSCTKCNVDTYKSTTGFNPCTSCQGNATTRGLEGAVTIEQCLCLPGFGGDPGQECSICARGRYEDESTDLCVDCGVGYDTATPGQTSCFPCPVGERSWRTTGPCEVCPVRMSTETEGSASCICDAGMQPTDVPGVCEPCPIGTYKEAKGNSTCVPCDSANFETTVAVGSTIHADCVCMPGYEPQDTANATSTSFECWACRPGYIGTSATPETPGFYKDLPGNHACGQCPLGTTFRDSSTVAASAAACDLCLAGYYGSLCEKCKACDKGVCIDGKLGDGNCTCSNTTGYHGLLCDECHLTPWWGPNCSNRCTCVAGECDQGFEGTGHCKSCDSHTHAMPDCDRCANGFSDVIDDKCDVCAIGHGDFTNPLRPFCAPCLPGTVSTGGTDERCTRCDRGHHQPDAQQSECIPCSPGFFATALGSPTCTQCFPGTVTPLWATHDCTPCAPGTRQKAADFLTCHDCFVGQYQEASMETSCDECGVGSTTANEASTLASDCFPCPLHTWKNGSHGTCSNCSFSRFTTEVGRGSDLQCGCYAGSELREGVRTTCHPCRHGNVKTFFGDESCTPCAPGLYFTSPSVECPECPLGGICLGGGEPPFPGLGWTWDPSSPNSFIACDPAQVCRQGGTCLSGHTGERCAQCDQGWFKDVRSGICFECPKSVGLILFLLFIVACCCCLLMVYFARKKSIYFAALQIGFNFVQVIGVLSSFSVAWPKFVRDYLNVVSAANFDLQLFRPECMVSDPENAYISIWMLKIFLPFIFVSILFLLYSCLVVYDVIQRFQPSLPLLPSEELKTLKRSFINAGITVVSLLYLVVGATALEIFPCKSLGDGSRVMVREPLVLCGQNPWNSLVVMSVFVMIFYQLGFPMAISFVLYKRRYNLWKRKNVVRYGLLFLRYRAQWFVFEAAVLVRKFGIVMGRSLFVGVPVLQVLFAMLVVAVAMGVQILVKPFRAARMNRLELIHLISGENILFLALIFAATQVKNTPDDVTVFPQFANETSDGVAAEEDARADATIAPHRVGMSVSTATAFGAIIVALITLNILFMFFAVIYEIYHQHRLVKSGVPNSLAQRVDVTDDFFNFGVAVDNYHEITGVDNCVTIDARLATKPNTTMKVNVVQLVAYPKTKPPASAIFADAWSAFKGVWENEVPVSVTTFEVDDTEGGAAHYITIGLAKPGVYEVTVLCSGDAAGKLRGRNPIRRCWTAMATRGNTRYDLTLEEDIAMGRLRPVMTLNLTVAPTWSAASPELAEARAERGLDAVAMVDPRQQGETFGGDCELCDGRVADVFCSDCAMLFCVDCCERRHMKGSLKKHAPIPLAKQKQKKTVEGADNANTDAGVLFCQWCEINAAEVNCAACELVYCAACSSRRHRKGPMRRHATPPIDVGATSKNDKCQSCEARAAAVMCPQCALAYCDTCFTRRHRKGKMVEHESVPVQSIPVESVPVQSIPVESVPVQSVPVESVPMESVHLIE